MSALLTFLKTKSLTAVLFVICVLPFFGLVPTWFHHFAYEHPSLLLGPPLILVPVSVLYFLDWRSIFSGHNAAVLAGVFVYAIIISQIAVFWGLLSARFICPEGYPNVDFSVPVFSANYLLPVWFADIICYGNQGVIEYNAAIVGSFTTLVVFIVILICIPVSFLLGRFSIILGYREDSGQMHFIRYFLSAMLAALLFLSLPDLLPNSNFLSGLFADSGRRYNMSKEQIAYYSPLHGAVYQSDENQVQALLDEGYNINEYVNAGLTPLALAVERKDANLVKILTEAGADINIGEKTRQSAMHKALSSKNKYLINYLLEKGGNPNAVGKGGYSLLREAVQKLDLAQSKDLLEKGADPNIRTSNSDQSLLFFPIFDMPTDYYKHPRGDQITSLNMARLLMDYGADLEYKARYDVTPLMQAIHHDNIWMVKLFLERGADVNARDSDGRNTLFYALKGRFFRQEILKMLFDKGVNIDNIDHRGTTLLMYFAKYGKSTFPLEWLLTHGADVNLIDKNGQTVLDKLGNGYYEDRKRKVLLKAGAKSALEL